MMAFLRGSVFNPGNKRVRGEGLIASRSAVLDIEKGKVPHEVCSLDPTGRDSNWIYSSVSINNYLSNFGYKYKFLLFFLGQIPFQTLFN